MSLQKAMSNIVYIKNNRDCAISAQWQIMVMLNFFQHRIILNPSPCPLPQGGEGKEGSIEDMPQNNFSNKVYSLFTTHHSLIHTDMVFARFTSHFSLK